MACRPPRLTALAFATIALFVPASWAFADDQVKATNSLSDALRTAIIAAVFGAAGWIVAYWLGGRRDDRTKRLQITLDQTATQMREFYAPLVALTDQLNSMSWVNDGATKEREGDLEVDGRMFKTHFLPIHDEIVALLKTKSHLREGNEDVSFTSYFQHYAAQKVYWDFVDTGIAVDKMGWPEFPASFFINLRLGHDVVQQRYEDCLKELRHRALPVIS